MGVALSSLFAQRTDTLSRAARYNVGTLTLVHDSKASHAGCKAWYLPADWSARSAADTRYCKSPSACTHNLVTHKYLNTTHWTVAYVQRSSCALKMHEARWRPRLHLSGLQHRFLLLLEPSESAIDKPQVNSADAFQFSFAVTILPHQRYTYLVSPGTRSPW